MLEKEEKAYALVLCELSDTNYKEEMKFGDNGNFNTVWQTYLGYRLQYKMFLLQKLLAKQGITKDWNFRYYTNFRIYSDSLYAFVKTACLRWNDIDTQLKPNVLESIRLVNETVSLTINKVTLLGARDEVLNSACTLLFLFDSYLPIIRKEFTDDNFSPIYLTIRNSTKHNFVFLYNVMELTGKIIKRLNLVEYTTRYQGFMNYLYHRMQDEKANIARIETFTLPFVTSQNFEEKGVQNE